MTLLVRAPQEVTEPGFPPYRSSVERFPIGVVLAAMVTSIALRARFLTTPLTADEGGYLAVARSWASGGRLYTDAWVDRPQGLVVLYRVWDDIIGGSTPAIRIMAMLFGCIAVVAVAYVVFALAGARAAGVAAILVAVASANARIEGFIANGELLAGAVGAASVAMACCYLFRGRGRLWLFASGIAAGVAISLKQSGCDGFLAVLLCLIAGGITRERRWREVGRECAALLAGLVCVLAVLLVHGIVVGLGAWWYAVAGYRLEGINATSRADWSRLGMTGVLAAPTIMPLAGAATLGLAAWVTRNRLITRATLLLPAWVCFAVVTFLAGGLFHRHYWVTLTFPLAAAAAAAVGHVRRPALLIAIAGLLALPSLISTLQVAALPRVAAGMLASNDPRSRANERIGEWYKQNRLPGSTLYALCASAGLYASADALPPYPYLWQDGVLNGKGAQEDLVRLFAGDHPPTFVVEFQNAATCNPGGQVAARLRQRYTELTTVDGLRVLMLHPGLAEPPSPMNGHSR